MPQYVQNDLYNTRIAHTMHSAIDAREKGTATIQGDPTTLMSPLKKIGSDPKGPENLFKLSGLDNVQWSHRPEILTFQNRQGVTPAAFDEDTTWRFLDRRFGFREEPQIRNDAGRTAKQKQIMQSKEKGQNEPIIVVQTMRGYNLLEGWHRTMNYLVSGAPPDQIEALQRGDSEAIDFNKWQPVMIQAYVGRGPEVQRAMAGTGEYVPPQLRGTDSWHQTL